jgi:hypothetical protein
MISHATRDPLKDHLLTPQNAALIIIDYQPVHDWSPTATTKKFMQIAIETGGTFGIQLPYDR